MQTNTLVLETKRLILRLPKINDNLKLQQFYERNDTHLSPWRSNVHPIADYTPTLIEWEKEFKCRKSVRFLLFLNNNQRSDIIGCCNFTQIFRGAFQACYLGYHIGKDFEGEGLMSEAVNSACYYMFEKENLHRIMAAYMPSNKRSAELLKNLGFVIEGYAKNYLFINGQWQDHVLTSLTNEKWLSSEK
jgi:ribosomal-protein-alanine N-acetyltransferase